MINQFTESEKAHCKASSYGAELSATSKNESQINSTEGLSDCLARFNALQQAVDEAKVKAFTPLREEGFITYYDREDWYVAMEFLKECAPGAIALANKLHAENERLKALLVATGKICKEAVNCVDNCCDCIRLSSDETLLPRVTEALFKPHAAGIGGE